MHVIFYFVLFSKVFASDYDFGISFTTQPPETTLPLGIMRNLSERYLKPIENSNVPYLDCHEKFLTLKERKFLNLQYKGGAPNRNENFFIGKSSYWAFLFLLGAPA